MDRRRTALAALACAGALALTGAVATGATAAGSRPSHSAASHRAPAKKRPVRRARHLTAQQRLVNLDAQRALIAYQTMQHNYYVASQNRYTDSYVWPYSQAMGATISVASLPGEHRPLRQDLINRLVGLAAFADHADAPPAGYFAQLGDHSLHDPRFNDDNEWVGIELLRLYHLDHQQSLVNAAGDLMNLAWSQWQSGADPCSGGVPWERITDNQDRNTVSNATGAELGGQLYLYTHNETYLNEAVQMYNWVRACLLQPDGLYADHISGDGTIDTTEWTYNQGEMIGAGVMLFKATGNGGYLDHAVATAKTAMAAFGPQQLAVQSTTFNAIYIRNLLLLGSVTGDPRYAKFAQWYADDAWNNVRDLSTGLFRHGPGGSTQLLDQASMAQLYALLAEPPSLT